jgi:hypothetical protein
MPVLDLGAFIPLVYEKLDESQREVVALLETAVAAATFVRAPVEPSSSFSIPATNANVPATAAAAAAAAPTSDPSLIRLAQCLREVRR